MVGGASVVLLAGVSALVLKGERDARRNLRLAQAREWARGTDKSPIEIIKPPSALQKEISKVEMGIVLEDIEATVQQFLEAPTVEEALGYVRGNEALKKRIRNYYQGRRYSPLQPRDLAPNGRVMKSGSLWAIDVVLQDFTIKPIAVERVEGGYRIDWESWVGYSEMPWDQFQATRPEAPLVFRVFCSEVDYYNFDFRDEKAWKSYRLESPDRTRVLYGYVARHSILESKLAPAKRAKENGAAFVLKLRYPEGAGSANQVLIEEVVVRGWVVESMGTMSRVDTTE